MGVSNLPSSDRIVEALRQEMLDGAWRPGARVKEEELCARFGAGRHTVRAAIRSLLAGGMLRHEPHKGAFVPELSRARIDEVCDFRSVIELGSLRLALAHGTDLGPVEDKVAALEALADDAPWRLATAAHREIHHAIVAASGNAKLMAAYLLAEDELEFMIALIRPEISVRELAERHRELVTMLKAGGEDAVGALRDDLESCGRAHLITVGAQAETGVDADQPSAQTTRPTGRGAPR